MPDLVDPNWYEYTYPEEREPVITEHHRVDVIFEGAVEMAENFTPEDAENEYNYQIEDLKEHHPNESWVVSIYDEGDEPPSKVKEHSNDPDQDDA